jgi:OmpA-OmpF porin, OOP family
MRFGLLLFFIGHVCASGFAQNLVPNPGFETSVSCPGGHSERKSEFRVNDWRSANDGTPDHFHECSIGKADVPYNWAGVSAAYEGEGYIGMFMWMNNGRGYREYAQCQLTTPLTKDSLYTILFRYKLSSYSRYAIDRIGVLLSDSLIAVKGDRALRLQPTFLALKDSALTDETGNWEMARWKFRARGGEQFITIGNFSDDDITRHYSIVFRDTPEEMLRDAAYYYVDGVELYPMYSEFQKQLLPEFEPQEVMLNTVYVLHNIQFGFNSYKLLSSSFSDLDKLAEYMLKNLTVNLQLSGHTDDRGGDKYNIVLSQNRARSVAKYLVLQGVAANRIEASGHGEEKPLVNDTSEEARRVNRRVEIKFMKPSESVQP